MPQTAPHVATPIHAGDSRRAAGASEVESRAIPDGLVAAAYSRLRRLAFTMLSTERRGHTLEPTALLNEALRRILNSEGLSVASGEQLHRLVTVVMRHVLVDHARAHKARIRREGSAAAHDTARHRGMSPEDADDLLAVHNAVAELRRQAPRRADVVEYYYFGGLSTDVIAEALGVSRRTVQLELALARHALRATLHRATEAGDDPTA